jgi:hypothetical protein
VIWILDSLSLTQALAKGSLRQRAYAEAHIWKQLVELCALGWSFTLVWGFSHCDVSQNDRADELAEEAVATLPARPPPCWYIDAARFRCIPFGTSHRQWYACSPDRSLGHDKCNGEPNALPPVHPGASHAGMAGCTPDPRWALLRRGPLGYVETSVGRGSKGPDVQGGHSVAPVTPISLSFQYAIHTGVHHPHVDGGALYNFRQEVWVFSHLANALLQVAPGERIGACLVAVVTQADCTFGTNVLVQVSRWQRTPTRSSCGMAQRSSA